MGGSLIENFFYPVGEDGNFYIWNNAFNLELESSYTTFKAHTPRVKRLSVLSVDGQSYLISCWTEGQISIWNLDTVIS